MMHSRDNYNSNLAQWLMDSVWTTLNIFVMEIGLLLIDFWLTSDWCLITHVDFSRAFVKVVKFIIFKITYEIKWASESSMFKRSSNEKNLLLIFVEDTNTISNYNFGAPNIYLFKVKNRYIRNMFEDNDKNKFF